MISYDKEHWEALIDVIIRRIGPDRFLEMTAYVLEQRGYQAIADKLAPLQLLVEKQDKLVRAAATLAGDKG
jgi:hypothetical protein